MYVCTYVCTTVNINISRLRHCNIDPFHQLCYCHNDDTVDNTCMYVYIFDCGMLEWSMDVMVCMNVVLYSSLLVTLDTSSGVRTISIRMSGWWVRSITPPTYIHTSPCCNDCQRYSSGGYLFAPPPEAARRPLFPESPEAPPPRAASPCGSEFNRWWVLVNMATSFFHPIYYVDKGNCSNAFGSIPTLSFHPILRK